MGALKTCHKNVWEKGDRQGKATNLLQEKKDIMCQKKESILNDSAEVQNLNRINLSVNDSLNGAPLIVTTYK